MNRFLKLCVTFCLIVGVSAGLYANGLNFNSNGSKAISMGGAFIGLADDYSAVFWNPAGLTQMKKTTLSLYVADVKPDGGYEFAPYGIDASLTRTNYLTGSVGFFKPLSDKIVAGIYVYNPSGLGAEWDGNDLANLTSGVSYEWMSYFHVITISPAIAIKFTDSLSLGLAINFNQGSLEIKKPALGQSSEDIDGWAVGATMGLLFKPNDTISLGVSCRLPLKATLKGTTEMTGMVLMGQDTVSDSQRTTTLPLWLGAGIAWKPTDKLTVTFDVQYTNWSKMKEIPITIANPGWNAIIQAIPAIDPTIPQDWEDATQIRVGVQYQVTKSLAIRAGYYNDPGPAPISTTNILLPEIDYNWITFGLGLSSSKFNIDLGFEYGKGKEFTVNPGEAIFVGTHSMNIFVPSIAISYKFN